MIRMLIKINEDSVVKDNTYTVEELKNKITEIFNIHGIDKTDEDGLWLGNNDDKDFSRFAMILGELEKIQWIDKYLEAWIWDVNGEVEDIMEQRYKKASALPYIEKMENSAIAVDDTRMQIVFALDIKKLEKLGANWYNIVLDITEYLNSKGFEYSRTLGFVNDRELTEEELAEIGKHILSLGYGSKYFLYVKANVISNTVNLTPFFKDEV